MSLSLWGIVLIALISSSSYAMAESIDETNTEFESDDANVEHNIGIVLNRVGEIDRKEGSFELDFYVYLVKDETDFEANPPHLDFVNGKIEDTSATYTEPGFYETRVQGKFFNAIDYRDFPFEKTEMEIIIEPLFPYNMSKVVFIKDDYSRVSDDAFITGWNIGKPTYSTSTTEYDLEQVFSRFTMTIPIERSMGNAILKNILPASIITGLSLITFWIPDNYTPRIYLTAPPIVITGVHPHI